MNTVVRRSATLREQVVDRLVEELRSGQFEPGERLTEQGLAERLEVSRTPVREALSQLAEQGLLMARPRGGYVVPSPTVEEIRQIIAVRMLLEPPAVRMAAAEYGSDVVEKISRTIDWEASAAPMPDPGDFARANQEFRNAMFGAISNTALRALIAQFANHLHFIRSSTLRNMELRKQIVDRQTSIRDAVAARDGDLAEGLWRSYLRFTEDVLVVAMVEAEKRQAEVLSGD